jgi:hypothetical protein
MQFGDDRDWRQLRNKGNTWQPDARFETISPLWGPSLGATAPPSAEVRALVIEAAKPGGLAVAVKAAGDDRLDVIAILLAAAAALGMKAESIAIARQVSFLDRAQLVAALAGKPASKIPDAYGMSGDQILWPFLHLNDKPAGTGLSRNAKIGIGLGVAAVLGVGVWALLR